MVPKADPKLRSLVDSVSENHDESYERGINVKVFPGHEPRL